MGTSGIDNWFESVSHRLSSKGFRISESVSYEGDIFRLVAHRSRFELTKFGNSETFFVFADFETLNGESMRLFSAAAFRYGKASRSVPLPIGLFESVYCFAVALVETLDEATAELVRFESPPKHWASAEIPVVYEQSRKKLWFFEKTPIWGAAYYVGFRNQIKEFLGGPPI